MKWDISKLKKCETHGHHAGNDCPLCVDGAAVELVAPAVEPVEEYDRSTWHRGPEKELHEWLETELIRLGVSYVHARTDQKSTIANGWPDFSCFYTAADGITRACFVELKNKAGRLSNAQRECIGQLRKLNIPMIVTGNFSEAVEFIKENLNCH